MILRMPRDPKTTFVPGQHKLEDLARLAVENSQHRGSRLTSLQKSALQDFRRVKLVPSETSTTKIANIYISIFDRLFFFGSLKGRISFTATGEVSNRIYGYTDPLGDSRQPQEAKIAVNTLYHNRKGRILQHLATMLHEMIDAYLMIHMLPVYLDGETSFYKDGHTGHGASWQDVA
jgi:hypothetical protein